MHMERHEDEDEEEGHVHHLWGPMKKEFKIAMLEKKEKIMQAKLDFIGKMKEMVSKMSDDDEAR